jgi:hypothetical protein
VEVEIRTVAGKTNLQEVMAYFRLTRGIRLRLMIIDDSVNRIVRSVYKEPDEEAVLLRQAQPGAPNSRFRNLKYDLQAD